MKYLKKLLTEENKTKIIGLLTILVLFWTVLYLIPDFFVSLFNTILGNVILIITVILVSLYNYKFGIVLGLIFLIIFRFSYLLRRKEGFTWNKKSEQDFLLIQNTINRGTVFDTKMIQESQASQEEVDYFNKYGMWPWSQTVITMYEDAIQNNPYIRTYSKDSINQARKVYNQAAILRIMSMQTKEGQFLIKGVLVQDISGNPTGKFVGNKYESLPSGFGDFGFKSGLIGNLKDDIIKCKSDNSGLEKITYTGKGLFSQQTKEVKDVDYNDLENLIPGFTFINGPCNPCGALKQTADYSCPFKLKVKDKPPFISEVWQYLWQIQDNPLVSQPSFLSENLNPNEFPLLSELQTELGQIRYNK
jgi:hypothetical protein